MIEYTREELIGLLTGDKGGGYCKAVSAETVKGTDKLYFTELPRPAALQKPLIVFEFDTLEDLAAEHPEDFDALICLTQSEVEEIEKLY